MGLTISKCITNSSLFQALFHPFSLTYLFRRNHQTHLAHLGTVFLLFCVITLLTSGCSSQQPQLSNGVATPVLDLNDTPHFQNQQFNCGAAALATLLTCAGVEINPEYLATQLFVPYKKGTLNHGMACCVRSNNRIPCRVHPQFEAILAELQLGHPVMVLQQNRASGSGTQYAVIIGVDTHNNVILRTADNTREVVEYHNFCKSWNATDNWALVVLKTDELPARENRDNYLKAIKEIKEHGDFGLAQKGYLALLHSNPDHRIALIGLANTVFEQQQYDLAAELYTHLLNCEPENIEAVNKLAQCLAHLHCHEQAIELIDTFLCSNGEREAIAAFLNITKSNINKQFDAAKSEKRQCKAQLELPYL